MPFLIKGTIEKNNFMFLFCAFVSSWLNFYKSLNSQSSIVNCSDFQHHTNLIALEVFRTATAFAPDLGRQFIPALSLESEALEKIFRQGEGEQML
jgi:hypothetical protein